MKSEPHGSTARARCTVDTDARHEEEGSEMRFTSCVEPADSPSVPTIRVRVAGSRHALMCRCSSTGSISSCSHAAVIHGQSHTKESLTEEGSRGRRDIIPVATIACPISTSQTETSTICMRSAAARGERGMWIQYLGHKEPLLSSPCQARVLKRFPAAHQTTCTPSRPSQGRSTDDLPAPAARVTQSTAENIPLVKLKDAHKNSDMMAK
mgnify:CR=1 FL=1